MVDGEQTGEQAVNPRVVFVTGGNRGIGLSIARSFARSGDLVIVSYRTGQAPEGLVGVQMDVTDQESVNLAFSYIESTYGPVDVLINNAGITKDTLTLRMSESDFLSVIDTNLSGAFRATQKAIPAMVKKRAGRVIFIGSVVGLLGSAGQANYAASKSGMVGMARALAREYGSRGVTFNVIAPGFVETDMTAELSPTLREKYIGAIPLGRFCSPEEIATVVKFIASPEASYITGAVIPVDGGMGMGH